MRKSRHSASTRFATLCGILVFTLPMVMVAGTSASADTFPRTILADNREHTYCHSSAFTGHGNISSYAMHTVLDSTTQMYDTYLCNSHSDVTWWAANLGPGVRGRWTCYDTNAANRCDRADIVMDFPYINQGTNDWYDQRKTAVHEVGHSVGLGHGSNDAMISGEVPNRNTIWRRYTEHHRNHINNAY